MGNKGQGYNKRKATCFKQRNKPWNKGFVDQPNNNSPSSITTPTASTKTLKRLTHEEFNTAFKHTNSGQFVPRAEGIIGTGTEHSPGASLRPKADEPSEVENLKAKR